MGKLLEILAGIFGGGAGAVVGKVATLGGVLAALAPIAIWLVGNKDAVFISITYGELAFWGVVVAAQLVVAYCTRPGAG